MKVLVIGQGGREHAIVKSLAQTSTVHEIHALPGSDGMKKEAICHNIPMNHFESITQLCHRHSIDYVFIGPELPLVEGLSDHLRERGILTVGPCQQAAQLEGSKIFAKEFMLDAMVPTAPYHTVISIEETMKVCELFSPPYVFKVDGLASGKGVFICKNHEELEQAARSVFEDKIFGDSGKQAILEQNLVGWELSLLVLTNGTDYQLLPLAQDHKRLFDHDNGPNTGGMGTIAPLKVSSKLMDRIENEIVKPSIQTIKKRNYLYRGVLFIGVMITEKGPYVLEYNVRLGDPETQVIMPLIQNDIGQLFKRLAEGTLEKLKFKNICACCVVLAAEGYPQQPINDVLIEGDIEYETFSSYFVHAGTLKKNHEWVTRGGRVLCAVGLGPTYNDAIKNAYLQSEKVRWKGMLFRSDIGEKITSSNQFR